MPGLEIIVGIFAVSFFLNLLWEVNHSVLYTTCYQMQYQKVMRLLTIMSLKDAFWITLFYLISVLIFQNVNILENYVQLGVFALIALTFSFIDERVSVRMGRWEYTDNMPTVFGVGFTPLLEVAVTGVAAFYTIFWLLL